MERNILGMCISKVIKRQINRLQEVSKEVDYSTLIASEALETEIKVSEEIRNLIDMHNRLLKTDDINLTLNMTYDDIRNNYIKKREEQEEIKKFSSMSFGEKITFYMEEIRMSLEELLCHTGLDETILNLLSGKIAPKELPLGYIYKLAKALELDMAEIGDLAMSCE